jgi:RHS repeat-associated protein
MSRRTGFRCQVSGVRVQLSGARFQVPGAGRQVSDVRSGHRSIEHSAVSDQLSATNSALQAHTHPSGNPATPLLAKEGRPKGRGGHPRPGEMGASSGRNPGHPCHPWNLWPAFLLAALWLAAAPAFAQVATGFPPYGSFGGGPFDTVNNANLNVHFAIPIVSKAGRGMPFSYILSYDSSVWSPVNSSGAQIWTPVGQTSTMSTTWGWRGVTEGQAGFVSNKADTYTCVVDGKIRGAYTFYRSWTYHDLWGTPHTFGIITNTGNSYCGISPVPSGTATATDGSGYTMSVSNYTVPVVYSRSGETFHVPVNTTSGASSVTDPNNNQISASVASNTTTFTDTLGTTALTVTVASSSETDYIYTGPAGTASFKVRYTSKTVQTNFGCSGITEYGATQQYLVSEIDLPDDSPSAHDRYTFTYETTPGHPANVTGRLASVTLPTGGQITYSYSGGSNGITCADGSAATVTRTVIPGGSGTSGTWTYAHSENGSAWTTAVTDPAGSQTTYNFQGLYETQRSNSVETVTTCYNGATSNCNTTAITLPIQERTATISAAGLKSKTDAFYDYNSTTGLSYGLPTKVDQYAYGSGVVGGFLRESMICYASLTNQYIHDRRSSVVLYSATGNSDCAGTTGLAAKITYGYDGNDNLHSENRYATPTVSISRTFNYSSQGVLQSQTDFMSPNPNTTTYTNFTCASNTAFPQTISSGGLTTTLAWDCNGGVIPSVTDPNGRTTNHSYDATHNFWRLAGTTFPDGGSIATTYTSPTELDYSTAVTGSLTRSDQIVMDGLGRVTTSSLVNDPDGRTYVETHYDSVGRLYTVSNPYRVSSGGGETYAYDMLNRVTSVQHADNNTAYAYYGTAVSGAGGRSAQMCDTGSYGYGYPSLTKDESGKLRQFWTDALGRTIEVDEPDPATGSLTSGSVNNTCYKYDVLGNLYQVVQGSETRNYTYDWLSRLTGAQTPESKNLWTYFYYTTSGGALCSGDPSAVCRKTDARGITATYTYDALNRLGAPGSSAISYSNGDPTPITYTYDQTDCLGLSVPCYNKTRRTTMTDASGTTKWAYDAMGRVLREHRTIGSVTKDTTYTYNLDGSLATLTYPSGRTVTYTVSAVGRLLTAVDSGSGITYVGSGNATYAPQGALATAPYGANITFSASYDNRLRASVLNAHTGSTDLFKLEPHYNNNSTVSYVTNDLNSSRTETIGYDYLNRVTSAQSSATSGTYCWGQSFSYDRYGNLMTMNNTGTGQGCWSLYSPSLSPNTYNQLSGFSYDNSGNTTSDGSFSYTWNGEGLLRSAGGTSCTYDGDGKRVIKSTGTYYWFSPDGAPLAETDTSGSTLNEYIYFSGGRTARRNSSGTVYYYFQDQIGTSRVIATSGGAVCYDADYTPFGQELAYTTTCSPKYKFTGMERDTETANDHTWFRGYQWNLGRWLSPDPLAGDVTNPQSLNRYAYVLNNPTTFADPVGLGLGPPRYKPAPTVDCDPFDVECTGGGGPAGVSTDPSDPCSYLMTNDPSCQLEPGLWNNGQPIYPDPAGGAGGAFGSPWPINTGYGPIQPLPPGQLLNLLLLATPQPECEFGPCNGLPGSMGNAAGFQKIGSWDIRHPSPESCAKVKMVAIGGIVGGAGLLSLGTLFPVTAPVTYTIGIPVAGVGAAFGIYYAAFCTSWEM